LTYKRELKTLELYYMQYYPTRNFFLSPSDKNAMAWSMRTTSLP